MQSGNSVTPNAEVTQPDCTFCQRERIEPYILKETSTFRLVADHAPLVEGHLLIIPRQHYSCYGAVPTAYDSEFAALRREVQYFFAQYYAPPIFWEHGVFRQTVFHAHLHCFPFGEIGQSLTAVQPDLTIHSQDDIRIWYATHGHYFYLADVQQALLFAADMDAYMNVMQNVLKPVASTRHHKTGWRSVQQRQEEGKPLISALIARWQTFQQHSIAQTDALR